jgi:NAD dependent epimerase/dehydratase family enzyme
MRCLASSLHRPLWLAVPAWPLRLAMGERSNLILEGVKASSQKVQDAGFVFQHPDLEGALHRLFQK